MIFNLACPASPPHYQYDPVQTTKISIHGAIHIYMATMIQSVKENYEKD
jgi:hypothetical protein